MESVEIKDSYIIIDKRSQDGKLFGDIRNESIKLIEYTQTFAVCSDFNRTKCKNPGKLIQMLKDDGTFKHLDKLELKNNISL